MSEKMEKRRSLAPMTSYPKSPASKTEEKKAENVQVVVRCRPLSQQETKDKVPVICKVEEKKREVSVQMKASNQSKTFAFDAAYGPTSTQQEIFEGTVQPIVDEVMEGYNCTIFAYGQTGTGKTFTMEGPPTLVGETLNNAKYSKQAGVITRCINYIFQKLESSDLEYIVKVSHLELYNEELSDLLNPSNSESLKLFEDPSHQISVQGLSEINVYNSEDIFNILQESWKARASAPTLLNHNSSRSHCIFTVTIHVKECTTEGPDLLKIGRLNLVDLAGSENIGRSGAKNERKTEAGMINKSLLTLGRVINALVEKSLHIPYRESKLTRLLQESLGGKTKTCIIATISPALVCLDETLNTLDYAHRSKNIKNQPQVIRKIQKKEMLQEYSVEINELKAQLHALRRESGVYLPASQYEKINAEIEKRAERIKQLEEIVVIREKEISDIQQLFDIQEKQLESTEQELFEVQKNLDTTRDILKKTEENLFETKEDLALHSMVLDEHKESEEKFHNQAGKTMETLQTALSDVGGLHQKIERQKELERSNYQKINKIKEEAESHIIDIQASVQHYIQEQNDKLIITSQKINQVIPEKQKELLSLLERVRQLEDTIHNIDKELANKQINNEAIVLSHLNRSKEMCEYANSELKDCLSNSIETKKAQIKELSHSVEQHKVAQNESSQSLKHTIDQLSQSILEYDNSQVAFYDNIGTTFKKQTDVSVMAIHSHNHLLKQFFDKQKAEVSIFKNDIIHEVEEALSGFAAHREKVIEQTSSNSASSLDSYASELSQLKSPVSNSISSLKSNTQQSNAQNITTDRFLLKHIDIDTLETHQLHDATLSLLDSMKTDTVKILDSMHNENDSHFVEIIKIGEEGEKSVQSQSRKYQSILDSKKIVETRSELEELLTKTNQAFGEDKSLITKVNTTEATDFLESYKEMSSAVASHVNQFSLKEYMPTGQTPLKKSNIQIPELQQVRSDKEILEKYQDGDAYPQDIHPLDSAKSQAKQIFVAREEQMALAAIPSKENVVQNQRPIGSYTPKRNASVRQKKIKDVTNLCMF